MRDRTAMYAAVPPSERTQLGGFSAFWTVFAAFFVWVFFPGSVPLGVGLLVAAVGLGSAWAFVMPPQRREKGAQPWLLAAATGAGLVAVAFLTGPYVLALANASLASYYATFTINVVRHQ